MNLSTRSIAFACCMTYFASAQADPAKTVQGKPLNNATVGRGEQAKPAEQAKAAPKVSFDDIIQHVVAKDPDVVIAQREVELAQAKLNAITQVAIEKVKSKQHRIESLRQKLSSTKQLLENLSKNMSIAEGRLNVMRERFNRGVAPSDEVQSVEVALNQAKERYMVAKLEADDLQIDLSRLTAEMDSHRKQVSASRQGLKWEDLDYVMQSDVKYSPFMLSPVQRDFPIDLRLKFVQGSPTDSADTDSFPRRLAVVMGKKITLGDVPEEGIYPLDAAQKVLAASGVDGMVKIHASYDPKLYKVTRLKLPKAQLPVRTWFELLKDECRLTQGQDCEIYVRDYGLMITNRNDAPAGAIPVFQVEGFKIDPAKLANPGKADDAKSKASKPEEPKQVEGFKIDPGASNP